MSAEDRCDVLVAGAGPAGSATARRLALAGARVLLVEAGDLGPPRIGETLAPGVRPLLAELGVWERFAALDPLPSYGVRSVWGAATPAERSYLMNAYGCGWHADRSAVDRMLADAAGAAGAVLLTRTRVAECEQTGAGWLVSLTGQGGLHRVTARVVVDATGRPARVARMLGARRAVLDRLVAVAAQLSARPVELGCFTLLETTPVGWWYSAPVGPDRLIAMLVTDADLCRATGLARPAVWRERLATTELTAARAGDVPPLWGPLVFPGASHRLRRTGDDRAWLAVGDAALAVDPASGSGFTRALRTAAAAAAAVLHGPNAIPRYEAELDQQYATYLQQRAAHYRTETRWATAPFWHRRRRRCP